MSKLNWKRPAPGEDTHIAYGGRVRNQIVRVDPRDYGHEATIHWRLEVDREVVDAYQTLRDAKEMAQAIEDDTEGGAR